MYKVLLCISWTGNIQGFSVPIPIHYLADYATKEWMCDKHITQILDLLQQDVIQEGLSEIIEIESASANLGPTSADCSRLQQTTVVSVVPVVKVYVLCSVTVVCL